MMKILQMSVLLGALMLHLSCAEKREILHSSRDQEKRFLPGQIILGEFEKETRETQLYLDHDQDGYPDRLDWDIDNDGIANLLDKEPFNDLIGFEDRDQDQIPDFSDMHDHGEYLKGEIQEGIYQHSQVVVFEGEERFSIDEFEVLSRLLSEKVFQSLSEHLKLIVKRGGETPFESHYAHYDEHWKQILFFPNEYHQNLFSFEFTAIHELFHVVERTLTESQKNEVTSLCKETVIGEHLNDYSFSDSRECFAESMTYFYLKERGLNEKNRYIREDRFLKSKLGKRTGEIYGSL